MIREHRFSDPTALAEALALSVTDSLSAALARRPEATLVVSGGSTPRPLFERLRRRCLPWERVRITLADERWVPPDHPESNEREVRQTLLQEQAREARWVGLKTDHDDPADGCGECTERVSALRPFEVVILGMGLDGHTASLFPGAPSLAAALAPDPRRVCVAVAADGGRRARMTLALPVLLDSRRIVLHFTGEEKWRVYQRARQAGPADELPLRAVLQAAPRGVDVYWAP